MDSGLHLYYGKKQEDFRNLVIKVMVSSILFISLLLIITSVFQLEYEILLIECVGVAITFVTGLFWDKKHFIYGAIVFITGFFIIGFLLGSKFVVDGLFVLVNQGIDAVATSTDHVFTKYAVSVSQGHYSLYASFFMVLFAAVLSLLCSIAVNGKFKSILLILVALFLVPMLLLGMAPGKWHSLFFAFGVFLAFGSIVADLEEWKMQCISCGILMLALEIATAFGYVVAPSNEVKPMFPQIMENLRYGEDLAGQYPMGQLESLDTINKKDKTALTITMEQPKPMYFKGYVGSTFDNQNWQDLPASVHAKHGSMFYWMHENGLYIQNQLSYVDAIYVQVSNSAQQLSQVTIVNENANRKYLYLPYEIADLNGFRLKNNSDTAAEDAGIRGQKKYVFEVTDSIWRDTDLLGRKVFELLQMENTEAMAYENAESHYNGFAYANYTSLTSEQREVFDRLWDMTPYTTGNHMNYADAKASITQFLQNTLTYDERVSTSAEDEDFLRSLLMETKTGCDIHYATVAALMYRYIGIPARYVEGYVVTKEDVAQMQPGEAYGLKGTRAHAWVEVYYDTIGWIPVEVTPGYEETMTMEQTTAEESATMQ